MTDAIADIARKYALQNAVEYGEAEIGAVMGRVFAETDADDPDAVKETVAEVCQDVNAMSEQEREEALSDYEFQEEDEERSMLPDLPDAEEGEVVLRFAPNPNGPPTLGSSRGMVINGELRDRYDGTLILRFDDTDPRTKRPDPDAYDWYVEDYAWLGYEPDRIVYSSKQFDTYYDYAEELIEMAKAYVCRCSPDAGRKHREKGEPCPHRDQTVDENMVLWKEMHDGTIAEGEATLKIKTDMQHKNPAIRDWVAFRIIDDPDHPITGDEHRVWPLLDFASAIEDHEQGTTHIVRGKDLRASTKRQQYIYDYFDWDYPHVRYWGRVSISGFDAPMSTSTLAEMIADGDLDGWDDVRAPTVRALRKRGFRPTAIQDFWMEMGVSETDAEASMETLETKNRAIIDPEVDRYFFVPEPIETLRIKTEEPLHATIPNHPEQDHGTRKYRLQPEDGHVKVFVQKTDVEDTDFLRLKDLCNVTVDGDTARVHDSDHTEAMERDASIVQWVPASDARDCTVHMPDGETVQGVVEEAVPGETVQFVRFGFVNVGRSGGTVDAFYTHQ